MPELDIQRVSPSAGTGGSIPSTRYLSACELFDIRKGTLLAESRSSPHQSGNRKGSTSLSSRILRSVRLPVFIKIDSHKLPTLA